MSSFFKTLKSLWSNSGVEQEAQELGALNTSEALEAQFEYDAPGALDKAIRIANGESVAGLTSLTTDVINFMCNQALALRDSAPNEANRILSGLSNFLWNQVNLAKDDNVQAILASVPKELGPYLISGAFDSAQPTANFQVLLDAIENEKYRGVYKSGKVRVMEKVIALCNLSETPMAPTSHAATAEVATASITNPDEAEQPNNPEDSSRGPGSSNSSSS